MAVFLRAIVMLVVLVGLPAAWVYYGPLPPRAQGVVDRVVEVAKDAIGRGAAVARERSTISAPHFDAEVIPAVAFEKVNAPQPAAPREALSATVPIPAISPTTPAPSLQEKLAPLLQQLRELGVSEYALEKWGSEGQLYRFHCAMPLAQNDQLTQHFEATHPQAADSIQQVLAEVTTWHTARHVRSQFK